jgi:solute carrier family 25 phosphate transporter 23/24/25/41
MQLQGAGGVEKVYKGPFDAAKQIVAKEGFPGLYRGMVPCYLKVVPAIAISFGTYELMRQLLGIEQRKTNFGAG